MCEKRLVGIGSLTIAEVFGWSSIIVVGTIGCLVALLVTAEPSSTALPADPLRNFAEHWSFQKVRRPEPPSVQDSSWAKNPIDRFILAKLEQKGWRPAPRGEPHALLRRMYLSTIGLPPSLEEQQAFAKFPTSATLDEQVDALLQHPGYGERWARYWLDLVRYADTNGYERDSDKPYAWRYRDYVIRSLNDDKPFNQFIKEQIAGDSLAGVPAEAQVGLGYYLVGPWDDEPSNAEQAKYDQLDDFVSTTTQVFLGIDFGCARCHDHKYDPITQEDYYSFAAIFVGVTRPVRQRRESMMRVGDPAEVQLATDLDRRIEESRSAIFDLRRQLALPRRKTLDASPSTEGATGSAAADDSAKREEMKRELATLETEVAELEKQLPQLPLAYVPRFTANSNEPAHVLVRGEIGNKGKQVSANLPRALQALVPYSKTGAITRQDLAEWLCQPDHVLVARVIVNRIWQYHFGVGLVRTPNDFGVAGEAPTHPELLDWLAQWFVHDAGWSLKKLHRLILTSNTYRMSQQATPDQIRDDPRNLLLAHFPRRRLDVEVLHDNMLSASDALNRKMYGPPFYPYLSEDIKRTHEWAVRTWRPFVVREASRRAVYAVVKRSLAPPLFEVLDRSDPSRSVGERCVSNGAPQALVAMNNEFVARQSLRLAERLRRDAGGQRDKQLDLAFRLTLCRAPHPDEITALTRFIEQERQERRKGDPNSNTDDELLALAEACRALFNLNEFYFPD